MPHCFKLGILKILGEFSNLRKHVSCVCSSLNLLSELERIINVFCFNAIPQAFAKIRKEFLTKSKPLLQQKKNQKPKAC